MALTMLAEQQDGLLTLTLNRPDKRNALNTGMYLDLSAALPTGSMRQAANRAHYACCARGSHLTPKGLRPRRHDLIPCP